ncbi:hypothetical protein GCM10009119_40170 [Algoriphagus jejuensis]|uniref:Uncharacterized protein n=1 Tax=Algoriphagus jejuensis TaxID=419934 RepID=A0ABN1N5H7_9BACT
MEKLGQKRSGIAPLQPPTLASFRTWGIQQELVVPLGHKGKVNFTPRKAPHPIGTYASVNQPVNFYLGAPNEFIFPNLKQSL